MNRSLVKLKHIDRVPLADTVALNADGLSVGQFHIIDQHDQDCCEHVYADWEQIKYHLDDINSLNLSSLEIKGVDGMGLLLVFRGKQYDTPVKVFIPCYNSQNGYYGDDLKLVIKDRKYKTETIIDITSLKEDID